VCAWLVPHNAQCLHRIIQELVDGVLLVCTLFRRLRTRARAFGNAFVRAHPPSKMAPPPSAPERTLDDGELLVLLERWSSCACLKTSAEREKTLSRFVEGRSNRSSTRSFESFSLERVRVSGCAHGHTPGPDPLCPGHWRLGKGRSSTLGKGKIARRKRRAKA